MSEERKPRVFKLDPAIGGLVSALGEDFPYETIPEEQFDAMVNQIREGQNDGSEEEGEQAEG